MVAVVVVVVVVVVGGGWLSFLFFGQERGCKKKRIMWGDMKEKMPF